MIIRSAGRRHCWSSKSKKRIGARVCCAAMAPARYRRGWAAFESDIVFAQADVFLLAAPGFLIGQQALDALGFSAQALFGPPQPVLMVRQAVGEISHVERTNNLVLTPKLLRSDVSVQAEITDSAPCCLRVGRTVISTS
jgi:hypothetical protein